jgi:hypothetical protein
MIKPSRHAELVSASIRTVVRNWRVQRLLTLKQVQGDGVLL